MRRANPEQNSRRRHLQRFLKSNALSVVLLWFPIIEKILSRLFKPKSQLIIATRQQSYVCRPSTLKRNRKRHSAFWIGLYGYNWIISLNGCQELVLEMMAAVRNKQAFYQQGVMAMMLIQQPL
ncbi:hypothetical protein [Nostoc sp.]